MTKEKAIEVLHKHRRSLDSFGLDVENWVEHTGNSLQEIFGVGANQINNLNSLYSRYEKEMDAKGMGIELSNYSKNNFISRAKAQIDELITSIQNKPAELKPETSGPKIVTLQNQLAQRDKEIATLKSDLSQLKSQAEILPLSNQAAERYPWWYVTKNVSKAIGWGTVVAALAAIGGGIAWLYSIGKDNGAAESKYEISTLKIENDKLKQDTAQLRNQVNSRQTEVDQKNKVLERYEKVLTPQQRDSVRSFLSNQ